MEVVIVKQRHHLEAFWEGAKKEEANWRLHPLIYTFLVSTLAQYFAGCQEMSTEDEILASGVAG